MIGGRKKKDCSDQTVFKGLHNLTGEEWRRAIECLYLICWPSVKFTVIRNSGTTADAEDVFQDTILVFLDNVVEKEKPLTSTLKAYFLVIARNLWLKKLRQRMRTDKLNENIVELENDSNLEELLENERRYQAIEDCKTKLSEQCREIIDSIYQKDRSSMAKIADNQNLANPHTARQIKYRCLKKLKSCVRKRLANLD